MKVKVFNLPDQSLSAPRGQVFPSKLPEVLVLYQSQHPLQLPRQYSLCKVWQRDGEDHAPLFAPQEMDQAVDDKAIELMNEWDVC